MNKLVGDNEEIEKAFRDAAIKDVIHKENIEIKMIENKMEPCHAESIKMCDLD